MEIVRSARCVLSDKIGDFLLSSTNLDKGDAALSRCIPQANRISVFEKAIAAIEEKIGLVGQPRVIVFHEKEGRRHCHCVWSRIDVEQMKAINLPYFKMKLRDISRQLYMDNDWKMPRGLVNSEERNPLNFNQAEWQQAKRIKQDPRRIKQAFQDCWAISDSRGAFTQALEERGYYLAKGDRRGHVAVDWRGEVYAISRMLDRKTKEVRARLGKPDELPSVEETKKCLAEKFTDKLQGFVDETNAVHEKARQALNTKREALTNRHRQKRSEMGQSQAKQHIEETRARSARLPTGLKALWFRVTGKYRKIKAQNEQEAANCKIRDQSERQVLIDRQLRARRLVQHEKLLLRHHFDIAIKQINRDMGEYLKLSPNQQDEVFRRKSEKKRKRSRSRLRNFD